MSLKQNDTALINHQYTYDLMSRLATVSDTTNTATYTRTSGANTLDTTVVNNGTENVLTVDRNYDTLNRLTSISSTSTVPVSSFTYEYKPNTDKRQKVTLADGTYWVYRYDQYGQVTSGKKYTANGTAIQGQDFGYEFDSIGNRKKTKTNGNESEYTSNELNQYTQRTVPGIAEISGSATEDANLAIQQLSLGNDGFTKLARTAGSKYFYQAYPVDNTAGSFQDIFRVYATKFDQTLNKDIVKDEDVNIFVPKTPELFTHDADGNMLTNGQWAFTWNGENRLIAAETLNAPEDLNHVKLEFSYDYMGRRVTKKVWKWVKGEAPVVIPPEVQALIDAVEEWREDRITQEEEHLADRIAHIDEKIAKVLEKKKGNWEHKIEVFEAQKVHEQEKTVTKVANINTNADAQIAQIYADNNIDPNAIGEGEPEWTLVTDDKIIFDNWNQVATFSGTTAGEPPVTSYGLSKSYLFGEDLSGTLQGAGGVGGLLAVTDHVGSKSYLPCYDGNKNIVAYVDATDGTKVAEYEYSPFGKTIVKSGSMADNFNFKFSSYYTDNETELVYYGYRAYNPEAGRWLNRDPIEEKGGNNLYGFVGNDGVNRWDRLGLKWIITREGKPTATACRNNNDNFLVLARKVGLDPKEYKKWLMDDKGNPVTQYPTRGNGINTYRIPNAVTIVMGGGLDERVIMGNYSRPVKVFVYQQFKWAMREFQKQGVYVVPIKEQPNRAVYIALGLHQVSGYILMGHSVQRDHDNNTPNIDDDTLDRSTLGMFKNVRDDNSAIGPKIIQKLNHFKYAFGAHYHCFSKNQQWQGVERKSYTTSGQVYQEGPAQIGIYNWRVLAEQYYPKDNK